MIETHDRKTMFANAETQIPLIENEIADFAETLNLSDSQFERLQYLLVEFKGAITIKAMIDGLQTAESNEDNNQVFQQRKDLIFRQNLLSFKHNQNFRI